MGNLKHVQPGQPLSIPASDWNDIIDVTRAAKNRAGAGSATFNKGSNVSVGISASNKTEEALETGWVVGLGDSFRLPEDESFGFWVGVEVEIPDLAVHKQFGIVTQSIDIDFMGSIAINGAVAARVLINDVEDGYCKVVTDSMILESDPGGSIPMLWVEDVSGSGGAAEGWAVISLDGIRLPSVFEATADESGGEITAKRIDSDGIMVGNEATFLVLPEGS